MLFAVLAGNGSPAGPFSRKTILKQPLTSDKYRSSNDHIREKYKECKEVMTIRVEKIAKSEKKADRFTVIFNLADDIVVSAAQIADFGIYSGRELSEEEYHELKNAIESRNSKARALRILGSRSLSSREIEKRLEGKGESIETAKATVEWLEENSLINDAEYAASIVSHYLAKGYGLARVKDELYRRGIPKEIAEDVLCGIDTSGSVDAARGFIEKKLKGSLEKEDLRSVTNALCRRGFSYDEARAAVRMYVENIGENDEMA